jgi:hypothetical protein
VIPWGVASKQYYQTLRVLFVLPSAPSESKYLNISKKNYAVRNSGLALDKHVQEYNFIE